MNPYSKTSNLLEKLCRFLQRHGYGDWTADMQRAVDFIAIEFAVYNNKITAILNDCPTCAKKAHAQGLYYSNYGSFKSTPAGKMQSPSIADL